MRNLSMAALILLFFSSSFVFGDEGFDQNLDSFVMQNQEIGKIRAEKHLLFDQIEALEKLEIGLLEHQRESMVALSEVNLNPNQLADLAELNRQYGASTVVDLSSCNSIEPNGDKVLRNQIVDFVTDIKSTAERVRKVECFHNGKGYKALESKGDYICGVDGVWRRK